MKKAIKVLEKRIEALNSEYVKVQKDLEEPETLGSYEFLMTDAANIELEIMEIQKAVEILNKQV